MKWAAEGDESWHFFHGLVKGRLKWNTISGVNANGEWVVNPAKVKDEIFNHFSNHFSEPEVNRPGFKSGRFKKLTAQQAATLQAPFTEEKVKTTVRNCWEDEAPGPDGFTFAFIKPHWLTIKADILGFIKDFERSGKIVKGANSTFLTLIPKGGDPLTIIDYRPISLVGC